MSKLSKYVLCSLCCFSASSGFSHDAGNDSFSLDQAIKNANAGASGDFTVNFTGPLSLGATGNAAQVRAVNSDPSFVYVAEDITINGNSQTLDGASGNARGLFVGGKDSLGMGGSVTINDLIFRNCRMTGGNGFLFTHDQGIGRPFNGGGGGGLGAGGGLYVGEGVKVTVNNSTFERCNAQGGSSAPSDLGSPAGAGGGMRGSGADSSAGGGGFGGNGIEDFGSPFQGNGGGANGLSQGLGNATQAAPGGDFDGVRTPPGADGIGGTGASVLVPGAPGNPGGFGGGGGGGNTIPVNLPVNAGDGGMGGFGSGGGTGGAGSSAINMSDGGNGGMGGFGGGGGSGGGAVNAGNSGGDGAMGGFGGGGGGGGSSQANLPGKGGEAGFGGGNGLFGKQFVFGAGGTGAGFGGAVFIEKEGDLTFGGSVDFIGNFADRAATGNLSIDPLAGFGALGNDIFMMSSSKVTFDITQEVDLQNPIEGDQGGGGGDTTMGGLTKKGPALLTLVGDNTYTGESTVEAGELRINGSTTSNIVVDAGAVLSGNFTAKKDATGLNGGDLTNSGIVCPGVTGLGRIDLEGNFEQKMSGRLVIDITPVGDVNDKLFLDCGSATLDGTLEVVVQPGNYIAGTTYEVINAPVTGVFSSVIETGEFDDLIEVGVTYSSVILTILNTVLFEGQEICPGPSKDVANAIIEDSGNIVPRSDFAMAVEILGQLDDDDLCDALASLSAVNFGALEWINARNNSYAADILSQHLYDLCCSPRNCSCCTCCNNTSGWVSVFGNTMNNQKKLDFLNRYNADAVGVLAGFDKCCGPCFTYGGAFGYTHTDVLWKKSRGDGKINSYYGALYGSARSSCFSADVAFLGGGSHNDFNRNIHYGIFDVDIFEDDINRVANSCFWGYFFTAHLGLEGTWRGKCMGIIPFGVFDYHYYSHEEFTEVGAESLNLDVESKDQNFFRAEAGMKWFYENDCGCYCVAPYIGLSWVGEFPIGDSKHPASFIGQTPVIDALSFDSSVQLGSPQAGIKWSHCNGASFLIGYKGLYNGDVRINELEGRFEWIF